MKHNKPKDRAHGISKRVCVRCGNHRGHIGKYGLHLCRHCFRDYATDLGFKKFR